jgi:hypothetical protein
MFRSRRLSTLRQVLIEIVVEGDRPLSGWLSVGHSGEHLRFKGWLQFLRLLSDVLPQPVGSRPPGGLDRELGPGGETDLG